MTLVWLFAFGILVGIVSGMLGLGGGIILVPGLMVMFQFSQPQAQGTSLAAMIPPIGIFAALVYYRHGYVNVSYAAAVAAGFMLGAFLGALALPWVPLDWLRVAFGALLLYVGLSFVFGVFLPKTSAALPAGLAGTLAAAGGWFVHRRRPAEARHPPLDDRTEYHI